LQGELPRQTQKPRPIPALGGGAWMLIEPDLSRTPNPLKPTNSALGPHPPQ